MCKSDSIFPYLQRDRLFKWFFKIIPQMNDNSSEGKVSFV